MLDGNDSSKILKMSGNDPKITCQYHHRTVEDEQKGKNCCCTDKTHLFIFSCYTLKTITKNPWPTIILWTTPENSKMTEIAYAYSITYILVKIMTPSSWDGKSFIRGIHYEFKFFKYLYNVVAIKINLLKWKLN